MIHAGESRQRKELALHFGIRNWVFRFSLGIFNQLSQLRPVFEPDAHSRFALIRHQGGQRRVLFHRDLLQQADLWAVTFTSLCTQAAIEGGLSPDTAYTVGSGCIRNLTACTVLTDVRTISYAMYKDFILRVHRLRRNPSWSAQIKSCAEYTELHLTEDLTIRDRAKRVSYTEYYLSRKFKGSCQSSSFE